MTYTVILNGDIDQDSPVTQPLVTALRDNPIAIAEVDTSGPAPISAGMWHYYDRDVTNDSGDGVIYDFSVDGGVSSVETPTFDAGYEYRLLGELSLTTGTFVRLDLYKTGDAAYNTGTQMSVTPTNVANIFSFDIIIHIPMTTKKLHMATSVSCAQSVAATRYSTRAYTTTNQTISKARMLLASGNFDLGKIWMMRRRVLFAG